MAFPSSSFCRGSWLASTRFTCKDLCRRFFSKSTPQSWLQGSCSNEAEDGRKMKEAEAHPDMAELFRRYQTSPKPSLGRCDRIPFGDPNQPRTRVDGHEMNSMPFMHPLCENQKKIKKPGFPEDLANPAGPSSHATSSAPLHSQWFFSPRQPVPWARGKKD